MDINGYTKIFTICLQKIINDAEKLEMMEIHGDNISSSTVRLWEDTPFCNIYALSATTCGII